MPDCRQAHAAKDPRLTEQRAFGVSEYILALDVFEQSLLYGLQVLRLDRPKSLDQRVTHGQQVMFRQESRSGRRSDRDTVESTCKGIRQHQHRSLSLYSPAHGLP